MNGVVIQQQQRCQPLFQQKGKEISQAVDRTEELRDQLRLSTAEFCRRAGIPYGRYYSAVQRRTALPEDTLLAIAKAYSVSTDWLLGVGEATPALPAEPVVEDQRERLLAIWTLLKGDGRALLLQTAEGALKQQMGTPAGSDGQLHGPARDSRQRKEDDR